jgi:hypothetical protein
MCHGNGRHHKLNNIARPEAVPPTCESALTTVSVQAAAVIGQLTDTEQQSVRHSGAQVRLSARSLAVTRLTNSNRWTVVPLSFRK